MSWPPRPSRSRLVDELRRSAKAPNVRPCHRAKLEAAADAEEARQARLDEEREQRYTRRYC